MCFELLERVLFFLCTHIDLVKFDCNTLSVAIYMKVKVALSYLTLCDPIDYTFHGILQDKILEWVVFPFSRGSFQPRD